MLSCDNLVAMVNLQIQISMTALAIPVKMPELARILLADTTAAVQQVLLENNVKQVSIKDKDNLLTRTNNCG